MASLGRNYETQPWTLLTNFNEAWTVSGGTTSLSPLFTKSAANSRKWTPAGNNTMNSPAGSFSLTVEKLGTIGLWVYVDTSPGGTAASIRIVFGESGYANAKTTVWTPGIALKTGWNFLIFDRWDDSNQAFGTPSIWTTFGAGNFTNTFDRIEIDINTTNVDYYFGGLYYGGRGRAKLIFGMDNGAVIDTANLAERKIYDVIYPKFSGFGWGGYLAIPGIGFAPNLSVPRTTEMYNAGWDVLNHSSSHTTYTSLTNQQITDDLVAQRNFMIANGWTRTLNYGAYPQNSSNLAVATHLATLGELYWRTLIGRYCGHQSSFTMPDNFLQLGSLDCSPLTLVQLQQFTNAAIRRGEGLWAFTHGLDTVSGSLYMSETIFNQWTDWLRIREQQGLIDIVSPQQYIQGLTSPASLQ